MSENKHPKISKKYLVIYSISLICFAAVLILVSFSSQIRAARLTEENEVQATKAAGALQNAQEYYENNLRLTEENEQLRQQLETQTQESHSLEEQVLAYQQYIDIYTAYRDRRYKAARELVEGFLSNDYDLFLSEELKAEFEQILRTIKY